MIARPTNPRQTVVFGTRGSALALEQTACAIVRVQAAYPDWRVESRVISTEGDLDKLSPLSEIGGRGVFTSALEAAVLAGDVDAAIHSAKDLPSELHPDVPIVAIPERADPRDVLVSRHGVAIDRLPKRPVIGTSSRRRAVQIARLRPDARIADLRGNIDTRLRKAAGPEFDAIVLAAAGLLRMGWEDRVAQYFSIEEVVPSPGQGAIAIQARRDGDAAALLAGVDEPLASEPVRVERAFLKATGAGCSYPLGAHAVAAPGGFRLVAMLADENGERIACADEILSAANARDHAVEIAEQLLADLESGRRVRLWNGVDGDGRDLDGARIVVTRPRRQAGRLAAALRQRGGSPVLLPTIRIEPVADTSLLDASLRDATRGMFDWLVFTSAAAVEICAQRLIDLGTPPPLAGQNIAVVGTGTAAAARAAGFPVTLVSAVATADGLAAALIQSAKPNARMLYPRSAIARDTLPSALRCAGFDVVAVDAYRTVPEVELDPGALEQIRRGEVDLITFASPSSVRNFLTIVGPAVTALHDVPAVCAGPVTLEAAKDAGFAHAIAAEDAVAEGMAAAAARLWRSGSTRHETSGGDRLAATGVGLHGRSGH